MQDRVIQCEHYVCEGKCALGREGKFWGQCQTCNKYKKKKHSRPVRTDNRKHKKEKIQRKEFNRGEY